MRFPPDAAPEAIAWPYWLLRYVATGDGSAFEDLVGSVGGSPPYGGVDAGEAQAVYDLLEAYRGPGRAPDASYDAVLRFIRDDPEARVALEIFRLHDHIASDPSNIVGGDVAKGAALADAIDHDGAAAWFALLSAQLDHGRGDVAAAARAAGTARARLLGLAAGDDAYTRALFNATVNAASFAALDGDFETARTLARPFVLGGTGRLLGGLESVLSEPPAYPPDPLLIAQRASDYLEAGDALRALMWGLEAVARLRAAGHEAEVCGLLGDVAVAFRRVGNLRRAIDTNRDAIELSRRYGDALNEARWSGNLLGLLLQQGDVEGASDLAGAALVAASRSGRPDQVAVAMQNLGLVLARSGRYAEAVVRMDAALEAAGMDPRITAILRPNASGILSGWADALAGDGRVAEARDALDRACALLDAADVEQAASAARILIRRASLDEAAGDVVSAVEALERAVGLLVRAGSPDDAQAVDAVRRRLAALL